MISLGTGTIPKSFAPLQHWAHTQARSSPVCLLNWRFTYEASPHPQRNTLGTQGCAKEQGKERNLTMGGNIFGELVQNLLCACWAPVPLSSNISPSAFLSGPTAHLFFSLAQVAALLKALGLYHHCLFIVYLERQKRKEKKTETLRASLLMYGRKRYITEMNIFSWKLQMNVARLSFLSPHFSFWLGAQNISSSLTLHPFLNTALIPGWPIEY